MPDLSASDTQSRKRGLTRIDKSHPRGRGGGTGPEEKQLGKDRKRDGASDLQGKPKQVRKLIDASPYPKK